jgi:mannosyltransferase OCH1-like enzyme
MFVCALLLFIGLLLWKMWASKTQPHTIPKNIFQTHKSLEYVQANEHLTNATDSWKQNNSFAYHFYNDQQMDVFMQNRYQGTRWLDAYNRLQKRVMKTDFWRYCVVYEFGGIYADADSICLRNPETVFINSKTNQKEIVVVHENDLKMFCQWVFAAPKESPAIRSVIDRMTDSILSMSFSELEKPTEQEVFDLTGPVIFSKGIREYIKQAEHIEHEHTRDYKTSQTMFVFPNARDFHANVVRHMFMGGSTEGWKNTL